MKHVFYNLFLRSSLHWNVVNYRWPNTNAIALLANPSDIRQCYSLNASRIVNTLSRPSSNVVPVLTTLPTHYSLVSCSVLLSWRRSIRRLGSSLRLQIETRHLSPPCEASLSRVKSHHKLWRLLATSESKGHLLWYLILQHSRQNSFWERNPNQRDHWPRKYWPCRLESVFLEKPADLRGGRKVSTAKTFTEISVKCVKRDRLQ